MQHVYSYAENLGNECADHAAALGAFALVSNHNFSTRWVRQSFDSASCFATCHNLGDVLEKLCDIGTERVFCLPAPNQEIALCSQRATRWFPLLVPLPLGFFFLVHSLGSIFCRLHE